MAAKYIVKEREVAGVGRPNMFHKRAIRHTPWRTVAAYDTLEEAIERRHSRTAGLFQRVVWHEGKIIIDHQGRRC